MTMLTRRIIKLISIDPGVNGGIVTVDTLGGVYASKMPLTGPLLLQFLSSFCMAGVCQAIVEQLNAGSVSHGPRKSSKTIWTQASNYQCILDGLWSAKIPVTTVTPAMWMRKVKGYKSGLAYKERKDWLKAYSMSRFPAIKVTGWNADALALYDVSKEFL